MRIDSNTGIAMDETNHLDFTKLLGFDIATDELSKGLNLQDETFSAKLGAKVGPPEITSPARGIDFQDPALGSRLGAKVGVEPIQHKR
jgi:hypothetical protein